MSSRRVRSSIWGKLSKLAVRKKAGSRKGQFLLTSLLEQVEKRKLMAFEVSNIQLISDTAISTSTNASGTWVAQYVPVRTAKIVATSIIDASRQVASWFDSKEEANKQANADVKFVEDVKDPKTQAATSLTQHEGKASASATTSSNDLSKDIDSSERRIRTAVVGIESTRAIEEAKARKKKEVALAGLVQGASDTEVDKAYQDDMAKALFEWQKGYANLTYTEGSEELKVVTETITEFGQAGKKYIEDAAGAEKTYTDALAPIIGTRTVFCIQARIDLLKASTGADNTWWNNTAQAWATHIGGGLTARGNAQRVVARLFRTHLSYGESEKHFCHHWIASRCYLLFGKGGRLAKTVSEQHWGRFSEAETFVLKPLDTSLPCFSTPAMITPWLLTNELVKSIRINSRMDLKPSAKDDIATPKGFTFPPHVISY